jgi:uncharacterized coiled-coil DUF342 family protein
VSRKKPFVPYLRVTETHPEDDPKRLAIRLAELLGGIGNKRADAAAFIEQAKAEKQKANDMTAVLIELDKRKRNPPAKTSRMDPYNTYDADMIKEERKGYQDRAAELHAMAADCLQEVDGYQREMLEVQTKLREGNTRVVPVS